MKSVIVFGFGALFNKYKEEICNNYIVVGIADNKEYNECIKPEMITSLKFDKILVCAKDFPSIVKQLLCECSVDRKNIDLSIVCREWGLDKLYINDQNELIAQYCGISAYVETLNDISTFNTVLIEKEYDVLFPRKAIVIDAGMNVGFASLFFLNQKRIDKVIAYEPFKNTLDKALRNFEINKDINYNKLEINNAALSNCTEKRLIKEISLEYKGSNTIIDHDLFLLPRYKNNGNILKNVEINCLDAAQEIKRIKDQYYDYNIIFKMDVEGSEYDILDSLVKGNELNKINVFVMEVHSIKGRKIDDIIDLLLNNGFVIYNGTKFEEFIQYGTGYLTAFKAL